MAVDLSRLKSIAALVSGIDAWTERAIKIVKTIATVANTGQVDNLYAHAYEGILAEFRAASGNPTVTFATASDAEIRTVCYKDSNLVNQDDVDTIREVFSRWETIIIAIKAMAASLPGNNL